MRERLNAAGLEAAAETGLALKTFPEENPFTLDQVLDEFWPEEGA